MIIDMALEIYTSLMVWLYLFEILGEKFSGVFKND